MASFFPLIIIIIIVLLIVVYRVKRKVWDGMQRWRYIAIVFLCALIFSIFVNVVFGQEIARLNSRVLILEIEKTAADWKPVNDALDDIGDMLDRWDNDLNKN